ncbi:MAG: OmpL47-type beta-barrel domain-containing protein, partial [Thermoplasmatota archaeon]
MSIRTARSLSISMLLVLSLFTIFPAGNASPLEDNSIPSKFDLRDFNGNNYVSVIKSQSGGTCWTHGTMAAIESNLMMTKLWEIVEGNTSEPDLAEYHLDWWNGFNNFTNYDRDPPGDSGLWVHYGGDYLVASAYLARGDGSVRDKDGQNYDDPPERTLSSYHRYYPMHVEWYQMDDDLNGIDDIKRAVMEDGAVATCMNADPRLRDGTYAHYQPPTDNREPNHAVAIVGWDDSKTTPAPLDGAWLIKNSWGSSWGNQGYFWISYYDKWACKHPEMGAVSFRNVSYLAFDKAYSYDYHGWRDTWYNSTEAFNSFIAERNEQLKGVNFYTTEDNTSAKVTIYDDYTDGVLSGTLWSGTRHYERKGLHTILFEDPLELHEDDDFQIMLNVSRGGIAYDRTSLVPTLLEPPTRGPGPDSWVTSFSAPNQSFFRNGTEWSDLYFVNDSANFCIKGLVGHVSIASPMTHDKVGETYTAHGPVSNEIDRVTVRIDNGEEMTTVIRSGKWSIELSDLHLTAGPHILTATGTQDGCMEFVSTSWVEFIFDDNDPVTSAALSGLRGNDDWFLSDVEVSLTGEDMFSDIEYTEFILDEGTWTDYSGPFLIEDDGIHQLSFRSKDIAGNLEMPRNMEIRIDKGPPITDVVVLGDMGSGDWYMSPVELRFISRDDTSGIDRVEMELDGRNMIYDVDDPPVISESGTHEFTFRSVDIAGNIENKSSGSFRIDRERPVTEIILGGDMGDNGWFISTATIGFESYEIFSGLAGIFYRVVDGNWEEYNDPISVVHDGRYFIEYYSEDVAGHRETVKKELVKVDKTPPATNVEMTSDATNNGFHLSGVTFTFVAVDTTSGVSSTYWKMDGGETHRYSDPFIFEKAGTHIIHYWTRDMAGNIETVNSATFSIDLSAPSVDLVEDLDGITLNTTDLLLHPVGNDPDGGELSLCYSIDDGDWEPIEVGSPATGYGPLQVSIMSEGVHVLALKGTDPAGRETIETYRFAINLTLHLNDGQDDGGDDDTEENDWYG